MLQRHIGCGVSRCRLRLLYVFGFIVKVGQNRCAETPRDNVIIKGYILYDPHSHSVDLLITQSLIAAKYEIIRVAVGYVIKDLACKVYGSNTCLRLCIL